MTDTPLKKVLFVDDDENLLSALRRAIRKSIEMETANGAIEGLRKLEKQGPFSVVVVDANMPRVDGATFLAKVRELFPDTVRIMLTGNSDQGTALRAVNEGHVFCFLTKPCSIDTLLTKIEEAHHRHEAIMSERRILEETVQGSVKLLSDMLSLAFPQAFKRSQMVQSWAAKSAAALGLKDQWKLKVAAMLWPLGDTMLPAELAAKRDSGAELTTAETKQLLETHQAAVNMLNAIPRLHDVSRLILMADSAMRLAMPNMKQCPHSKLLQILIDLSREVDPAAPGDVAEGMARLAKRSELYDAGLLTALPAILVSTGLSQSDVEILSVGYSSLHCDDILMEDVIDNGGKLLLAAGQALNPTTISALSRLHANGAVSGAVRIVRKLETQAA